MAMGPLALVPAAAALFYLGLVLLLRRRTANGPGLRQLRQFVLLLAVWSTISLTWRVMPDELAARDYMLRALVFAGFLVPL